MYVCVCVCARTRVYVCVCVSRCLIFAAKQKDGDSVLQNFCLIYFQFFCKV